MKIVRCLLAAAFATFALTAAAQLTIEINGAGANRVPISVVNFDGDRALGQALTSVIRTDLDHSGSFRLVDSGAAALADNAGRLRAMCAE